MGRGYKRKTAKRNSDVIRQAVFAISHGTSLRQAALQFDIPRSTLLKHRRVNGIEPNMQEPGASMRPASINDIVVVEKGRSTVSLIRMELALSKF